MAKRPDISVIMLFNRQVVRADFSTRQLGKADAATSYFLHETVDVESTFWDSVSQVIAGYPPPGSRIVVLSTDVWSQVVSLPRLSVSGISPEELEEVLKFEAETLSGIDIDDLSLAFTPLGPKDDQQNYWVSAIRRSDLDDVNKLLESVGCREISVAHPAGLSGNSATRPQVDSIEIWDDLAFYLTQHATKLSKVKQASPELLTLGIPVLANHEFAKEYGDSLAPVDESNLTVLIGEESFVGLSAQIATNYVKKQSELAAPLIHLTKRSRGTPARHLVSGLIAIAIIGFCFWHWHYVTGNNESLQNQIRLVQIPATAKKKYDGQLISILEQRAQVEIDDTALGDDLKRVRFFLENQSDRIAKLLTLLTEVRTDDLVIQKIGGTEEGVSIAGISLNGEAAQAFAKKLREQAMPMGWVVNPASQKGQQKLTTGGPWDYEILLTDTGPFESAVQPRKKISSAVKSKP